jgi:hypothetical protein
VKPPALPMGLREPLKIFVGFDSREPAAFAVCAHSIVTRAGVPVSITPLTQPALRSAGLYSRERNPLETTEFSFSRFLVPALCGFSGFAVFMDCDFLVQADITELFAYPLAWPDKAVFVCQHDYTPKDSQKFFGQTQTAYPRKNWSSLIVFRNERCTALTLEFVNTASGLELHRFLWAGDAIGDLPLDWNHLVTEYPPNPSARALHWTNGGPWVSEYRQTDHADLWLAERDAMLGQPVAVAV